MTEAPNGIPSVRNLAAGIDVDAVRAEALAAAERARAIDSETVRAWVDAVAAAARWPLPEPFATALLGRLKRAPELVTRYLDNVRTRR